MKFYEDIAKELNDRGYDAETVAVSKNGISKTGIVIGKGRIRATFYPSPENSINAAVEIILKEYEKQCIPKIDLKEITSWEFIKDHMQLCIQKKTDEKILKKEFLDMEMYIRVDVLGTGTYKLLASIADCRFGADIDEVFSRAMARLKDNIDIMPLKDVIGYGDFPQETMPVQLVVTTKSKLHGASAICCDDLLRAIANRYESNFVILPLSIHECIISVDNEPDMETYHEMVAEVNRTHVYPIDQLTSHAYFYDRATGKITW